MKRRKFLLTSSGVASASIATIAMTGKAETNTQEDVEVNGSIETIDGDLKGYFVKPNDGDTFPAVVVLMEAFGLNDNIKSVCDRFAKNGFAALAPDFYYGESFAYTDIENAIAKLKTMDDEKVMTEFGKSCDFLAGKEEIDATKIGTTGFCMGGRFVYLANAVHASKVKAAVAFYGGGIADDADPFGRKSIVNLAANMTAPVMLIYGSEDNYIKMQEHEKIATALSNAKKRYVINVFDKAGHGFVSDRRDSYEPKAAAEAWEMTMSFFKRHLNAQEKG
jgi:carboxymethylenebutenolidase